MREIKFEYVGRNKMFGDIMREVYTLDQIVSGREILTFFSPDNKNCEMLARRQYTGLKDKNGVEIYEGDWLCWNNNNYEVVWQQSNGRLYLEAHKKPPYEIGYCLKDWIAAQAEVIGNIYQNPELLA